jgi:hypothetical protein
MVRQKMEWNDHGCPDCRRATLTGMAEPLKLLASDTAARLYVCKKCGDLWEENLRFAKPLAKEDAKKKYPGIYFE